MSNQPVLSAARPLLLFLLLPLLLFLPPLLPAQQALFSEARMTARLRELTPLIEEVLGEKLPPGLSVKASSQQELEAILTEEQVHVLRALKDTRPLLPSLVRGAKGRASLLANAVLGKVSFVDGRIHILPQTLRSLVEDHELLPGVLDLVLVHEAVHAHQNAVHPFSCLFAAPGTEETLSVRDALIEGHAECIMRRVARKLDDPRALAAYGTVLLPERRAGKNPSLDLMLVMTSFSYQEGSEFVEAVAEEWGTKGLYAKLLRRPPLNRREITHPAEYLSPPKGLTSLEGLGKRVESLLTPIGFRSRVQTIPHRGVQRLFTGVEPELVSAAMEKLRLAVAVVATPLLGKGVLSGSVLCSADEEGAARLMRIYRLLAKSRDEVFGDPAADVYIAESKYSEVDCEAGKGFFMDKLVVQPGDDVRVKTLVLANGPFILEMMASDLAGRDLDALIELAVKVAGALPSVAGSEPRGIRGVVRRKGSGQPVAEASVALRAEGTADDAQTASANANANARGEYALADVAPGRYVLICSSKGTETSTTEPVTVGEAGWTEHVFELDPVTPTTVPVEGRVAFRGEEGRPQEVEVRLWDVEPDGRHVVLRGTDGRFSGELPVGSCRCGYAILDGVVYDDRLGRTVRVKPSQELTLQFRRRRAVTVVVCDQQDHPLAGGEAWLEKYPDSEDAFPLPDRDVLRGYPIRTDDRGRLRLPPSDVDRTWWVRSPDHAWQRVVVRKDEAGARRIPLVRSGTLAIEVPAWSHLSEGALLIDTRGGPVRLSDPDASGKVTVQGLRPGPATIRITQGVWFHGGPELVKAEVALTEGQTTAVRLDLDAPPTEDVAFSIGIPKSWGTDLGEIAVEASGAGPATRGIFRELTLELAPDDDSRTLSDTLRRLRHGPYDLTIREFGWSQPLVVAPGVRALEAVVPEAGTVLVTVTAGASKKSLDSFAVSWKQRGEGQLGTTRWSFDGKPTKVRVIAGPVTLEVTQRGYATGTVDLDVAAGQTSEVTVHLEKE